MSTDHEAFMDGREQGDLVERLRQSFDPNDEKDVVRGEMMLDEAADEIARLRAEIAHVYAQYDIVCAQRDQLLAALKFYADEENWREEGSVLHFGSQVRADEGEIARAAIAAVETKL
jgi:hypothetical protein